jgi:hypothetical protein
MMRWLTNLLSAVSLLLLAAVLVLWVRGYWASDHFWLVYRDDGAEMVRSSRGRLTVRHVIPNVRGIPVPRRLSHWAVSAGSQLAPRPSVLHWEGGGLVYEGTPAPTRQEIAAARVALKEVADERAGAARGAAPGPRAPQPPPRSSDPMVVLEYERYVRSGDWSAYERARLQSKEDSARQMLDGSYYHEWTFPAWLAAAVTAHPPVRHVRRPALPSPPAQAARPVRGVRVRRAREQGPLP